MWIPNQRECRQERTLHNNELWETWFFQRGRDELLTEGWMSCCWVPKRDEARWSENSMPRCNALKNGHLPERKGWALYRRVSEVLLSPKEMTQDKVKNFYAKLQRPEKREFSWEKGLSSLPEDEWAFAECQRGMVQRMRRMTTR